MKNLVKKAIEKAKDVAKNAKKLKESDPGFWLAMALLTGVNVTLLVMRYGKYVDGWNDGAEETRKNLITALVNNRIGYGESEADAFKLANGLVEYVERK